MLWLLCTAAWRPLFLPDEARQVGMAYEMLRAQADGITVWPTLNGLTVPDGLPLLMALETAAMRLFGTNEWAARCGPALLAWFLGMAVFLHARRCFGLKVARLTLLVLATCPAYFLAAQFVGTDIGAAACITAAVLAFMRAVEDPRQTAKRWLFVGWLCCGLGVLADGLEGVILPALILVPWLLAQRRWKQTLHAMHPVGVAIFFGLVAPWLWALESRFPGFAADLALSGFSHPMGAESVDRTFPIEAALVLPLALSLPWSVWLVALRPQRLLAAQLGGGRWQLALYGWWLVVVVVAVVAVVFAGLPTERSIGAALPALAPAVLVLGLVLTERRTPWWRMAFPASALCVMAVVFMASKAPQSHRELAQTLAQQMKPGDRVAFIDAYFVDVPFYAALPSPVLVVADWHASAQPAADWRQPLLQALQWARPGFARPEERASWMWGWERVPELACHSGAVWLLAGSQHRDRLETQLSGLLLVRVERGVDLISAPRQDCPVPVASQ